MHHYDIFKHWEPFDGRKVRVNGLLYQIKVSVYNAIYPYPQRAISVHAELVNKSSRVYRETKRKLGDDWSTDLLDSDATIAAEFLTALGYKPTS